MNDKAKMRVQSHRKQFSMNRISQDQHLRGRKGSGLSWEGDQRPSDKCYQDPVKMENHDLAYLPRLRPNDGFPTNRHFISNRQAGQEQQFW